MRPNTLKEALIISFKADVPAIIWGDAGVGKSQIVQQTASEMAEALGVDAVPVVDLRLATQEVGDITGVPYHDPETNCTQWGRPSWWKTLESAENSILFLDEVNRAPKEVVQAIFQLVLDRRLHTHVLPKGTRILAACNPPEGDYITDALDPALNSRFMHLKLDVHASDWIENCIGWIEPEVIGFISSSNKSLMSLDTSFELAKIAQATPRTWEMAGRVTKAMGDLDTPAKKALLMSLLTGLVGTAPAMDFVQSLERQWTSVEDILSGAKNYKKIREDQSDLKRLCIFLPTDITPESLRDANKKLDKTRTKRLVTFLEALLGDYDDLGVAVLKRLVDGATQTEVRRSLLSVLTVSKALMHAIRRAKYSDE